VNRATSGDETSGVVHVALDESFSALVAVGAVVVEHEFLRVNNEIENLYYDLKNAYYLEDLKSFERFKKNGFHSSYDPDEVSSRFINFLSQTIGFKSFIFFTNRTRRPDLSDKKVVLVLYAQTLRAVLRKYQRRPKIVLHFEQHQQLSRFYEPLVLNVLKGIEGRKPVVEVISAKKMEPPLLAIVDYVIHTFVRWYVGNEDYPPKTSTVEHRPCREIRAIRRSISVARSLEDGTVAKRDLPGAINARI
jgi:hypothetical protein